MKAYVDSSVVMRLIVTTPHTERLREWPSLVAPVTSALAKLECFRTIERLRLSNDASEAKATEFRTFVDDVMRNAEVIAVHDGVLARAAASFAKPLKTLDAIHLATALLWREQHREPLLFATHDQQLARAARAVDFDVIGI